MGLQVIMALSRQIVQGVLVDGLLIKKWLVQLHLDLVL